MEEENDERQWQDNTYQQEEYLIMSYVISTKIRGKDIPVCRFDTYQEASDFETYAEYQSTFTFDIHKVKDAHKQTPEAVLAELHDEYGCWNIPTSSYADTFEGYKRGE